MVEDDDSAYVRLSQFLELESHWFAAGSRTDLCHRICRTTALLLDAPCVALGLAARGQPYGVVASEGDWSHAGADEMAGGGLVVAARATRAPQIKSAGDESLGVFPFTVSDDLEGCLHMRLPRPVFRAVEISFLRFVASHASLVLKVWKLDQARAEPAAAPKVEARLAAASARSGASGDGRDRLSESAARRYVAMAVHDLRNPLNVVAGYTALLDEESLGSLTAQQREAIDAIKRQVSVLLSSVDQLLELDRMPKERGELAASRFELRQLFEDLRGTCFAHCTSRVKWPGAEAAFDFTSDRRRLYSIAQNLVDNALKHTHGGDIVVACVRSNDHLVLSVRDQGPGLDRELRTKLIDHAQSGTETAPRSGLGLYTIASHVHALRGAIEIDSPGTGSGTHISVSIPDAELAFHKSNSAGRTAERRPPISASGRGPRARALPKSSH